MEHGLDTQALAVVAGCVLVWGLLSARLERINVTAPIAFVLLGLAVSNEPLSAIDIGLHSASVRHIAEITLALVLFADASRVNLSALRADVGVPARLLGIGLPLTIAAGTAAALLVTQGDLWLAAVIGASVAPTDAALGASIMHDERVPARVRRILNVESGLNDGIATPFVSFFIAGAAAAAEVAHADGSAGALADIAIGIGIGIGIGAAGGLLLRLARTQGWSAPAFQPLAILGLALLAYAATVEAGGNGFVAGFVGGIAFGTVTPGDDEPALSFTDDTGELLSLLVWFLFGATMIVPAFEHIEWSDAVFAVLALTVARMVPVAISLIRSGLDRSTVLFVGWFGPRGLASVVFALIAVDSLDTADGNRVLAVVTITILLSVVAHGLTASPFAARYGEYARRALPERPEHAPARPLRTRTMAGDRRLPFSRRGST